MAPDGIRDGLLDVDLGGEMEGEVDPLECVFAPGFVADVALGDPDARRNVRVMPGRAVIEATDLVFGGQRLGQMAPDEAGPPVTRTVRPVGPTTMSRSVGLIVDMSGPRNRLPRIR